MNDLVANQKKYSDYLEINDTLSDLEEDKINVQNKINIIKMEKEKNNYYVHKFNDMYILSKAFFDTRKNIIADIHSLNIIKQSMINNGLVCEIVKNMIVPKLNNIVNKICKYIGYDDVFD